MTANRRTLWAALLALGVLLLDRLTKRWSVNTLRDIGSVPVIEGVLHFTYAENRGAAFSMLSGRRWLLIAVSLVTLALLLVFFFKKTFDHRLMDIALPLIVGGAVGNLLDRIVQGYVVDFIEVRFINFAIFNIADCGITVGAGLMILYVLFFAKEEPADREEGAHE